MINLFDTDTICAVSTPNGTGGIAVVRISGPDAIGIADRIWRGKRLAEVATHTAHLGNIVDPENPDEPLDSGVTTVFREPKSFTGEDVVEFSVHGSVWIQRELLNLLVRSGCRMAEPGEFTRRAFTNGRLDLVQAEAVADMIATSSRAAHRLATSQMRGDFSKKISGLRDKLIEIASLIELELDFSEEEVEFASRSKLLELAEDLHRYISRLTASFATGSAIKNGIPVAIVGEPNVGKSTLLNRLIADDRAIVSDIPGTTRDTIEDTMELGGVLFRFIDTAGLRETSDRIESLGIERSFDAISRARIVLWLITPEISGEKYETMRAEINGRMADGAVLITVINKMDTLPHSSNGADFNVDVNRLDRELSVSNGQVSEETNGANTQIFRISASKGDGIDRLIEELTRKSGLEQVEASDPVVTNARHYEALRNADESLLRVIQGIQTGLSGDFIAQDLRETISHLSSITGTITTTDLLTSIFKNFCVGK